MGVKGEDDVIVKQNMKTTKNTKNTYPRQKKLTQHAWVLPRPGQVSTGYPSMSLSSILFLQSPSLPSSHVKQVSGKYKQLTLLLKRE